MNTPFDGEENGLGHLDGRDDDPPGDHMVVIRLTFKEATARPIYQVRAFGTQDECVLMAENVPDVVYTGGFTVDKAEIMILPRGDIPNEVVLEETTPN
jgi:hypothetical protein